jgi:GTP-binding protein EngB required for normal cell division
MRLKEHIIAIGNPGGGKSALLNSAIQKALFRSGISLGTGLTRHLQLHEHNGVVYGDTPGLADAKTREDAAKEIAKALRQEGAYKLFFVVTLEAGRVRPQDALTIRLVLEALPDDVSYGIVINKVSDKLREKLQDEQNFQLIWNGLGFGIRPTMFFHIYPYVETLNDAEDQLAPVRPEFAAWLRELPATYIKPADVKDIQTNE